MRVMAKSAWTAATAFLGLLLLWTAVQFYVWTPSGVRRDSLVYTLKIPDRAKRVALWNPHDEPTYDRSVATGIAPDTTLIHYRSKSAIGAIERRARAEHYECQRLSDLVLTCHRKRDGMLESQVTTRYVPKTGLSEITVYLPE
jgi:hypothetical protein